MNDTFQELMQQLGQAINDAVMNSDEVEGALERVRSSGIDVFLMLEATICVRRRDGESVRLSAPDEDDVLDVDGEDIDLSPEDRTFLRRLRISVDTEGA